MVSVLYSVIDISAIEGVSTAKTLFAGTGCFRDIFCDRYVGDCVLFFIVGFFCFKDNLQELVVSGLFSVIEIGLLKA